MTIVPADRGLHATIEVLQRVIAAGGEITAQDTAVLAHEADSEWMAGTISKIAPRGFIIAAEPPRAAPFHARTLVRVASLPHPADRANDAVLCARTFHHARMLGHLLAPERPEFRPCVTVLIPVFNRAGPLVEAVQSCLDQTWRPIEILVIDDGSTDDPAAALTPFGKMVRLHRKANGGVASARNLGVGLATGDFIHFLDSDDLLLPRAVESKLAAFGAVADAELCHGQARWIDMRRSPPDMKEPRLNVLDNPMRALIVTFPFSLQTTMIPRWRLLAAAPFEEDLRRSSDFRYWQCLGLAGVKVVGSREVTTLLRRFHDSLHLTPEPQDDSHAVALMRGLRDLARHPDAWCYGAEYLNIVAAKRAQYWFIAPRSERVRKAADEAIGALEEAGRGTPSPLPMFAAIRGNLRRLKGHDDWPDEDSGSVYRALTDAIERCIAAARPLREDDVVFWSRTPEAPMKSLAVRRLFTAIERYCAPARRARLVDALLRAAPRIPPRRVVRRAALLQRAIGAAFAAAIVTRRMSRKES